MKLMFVCLLIASMVACNTHNKVAKQGLAKVIAVYTKTDSTKVLDVLLRQITKTIKNDSATNTDHIGIDTLWAYPAIIPATDTSGKPVLDSMKKQKMMQAYILINKDSVNWHVENIPIDSLLKK